MICVYQSNGHWVVNRENAPEGVECIELKRMIPTPVKAGYEAKLNASLETGRVWFDLVETLDGARARVIAAIEAHDKSAAVNSFTVGGQAMWLDREERTSLARTISLSEQTTFSMWAGGSPPVRFDIPIAMASGMLDELERYAAATYNVTQSHIAAVYALGSVVELEAYDFTVGYPDKLEFNL